MAFRTVLGCCILCAAYCVVDKWLPGLLPQITVTARIGAPHSSPAMASALDRDGKHAQDADHEASGVDETCSATQGDTPCAYKDVVEPPEHNDSIAVPVWSRAMFLLSEHLLDTLVPPDHQSLLRDAWTVLHNVDRASDVGYYKPCLLVASIFCFVVATGCCKGSPKKNTREVKPSSAIPVPAMAVDWKSNFSISEMARLNIRGNRDERERAYEKGTAAVQLSREDAAATAIQRWARCEFKRWLRSGKSQSSIKEPPLCSQHRIDHEDHGMVVNTALEGDTLASTDKLRHLDDDRCSDDALPFGKRCSQIKVGGCDDA